MKSIKFTAVYGDIVKQAELSEVSGVGSTYFLYIDRYFYGSFASVGGKWVYHAVAAYFTIDDIQILTEFIEVN